jgi:hypothetical protein
MMQRAAVGPEAPLEMKVLLRGDRGTGKTTLLELLRGTPPADLPPYTPTNGAPLLKWGGKKEEEA